MVERSKKKRARIAPGSLFFETTSDGGFAYQHKVAGLEAITHCTVLWLQLLAWQAESVQPTCVQEAWLPALH
jgi:hypothetical protein